MRLTCVVNGKPREVDGLWEGESLLFEVPRAPEGSKLRFGGQEQTLQAGKATFPLAADSLRVGDKVVLASSALGTFEWQCA